MKTLQTLEEQHQILEKTIEEAYKNYMSDDEITELKKERLRLKEQIDKENA
jgi:hypothetical protein